MVWLLIICSFGNSCSVVKTFSSVQACMEERGNPLDPGMVTLIPEGQHSHWAICAKTDGLNS